MMSSYLPPVDGANILRSETQRLFSRSVDQWEKLRGASIFLTGATGLFGRWILEAILHAEETLGLGLNVVVLTRDSASFRRRFSSLSNQGSVSLLDGDVKNFDFTGQQFDYVIHGATTSAAETFSGETSLNKFDTLVSGTRHVLDMASSVGVKRLLFLSSGVAYGGLLKGMTSIPEDFSGAPDTSDYRTGLGQAKRAAEYLCAEYAHLHNFDLTIARCFSFAGPLLPTDLHYAFGNFIHQALYGNQIVVRGDGTPIRSYLYLGDMVIWLITLLAGGGRHTIYNIGSDHQVSIAELAQLVQQIVSPNKKVKIQSRPSYSVGNVPRNIYVPDIQRACNEFGLNAWTSLDEIIKLTAQSESG